MQDSIASSMEFRLALEVPDDFSAFDDEVWVEERCDALVADEGDDAGRS
jgi:hypothetical protein